METLGRLKGIFRDIGGYRDYRIYTGVIQG